MTTLIVREVQPDPIHMINRTIAPFARVASVRDYGVENPVGPFGEGLHEVFIYETEELGVVLSALLSAGFDIVGGTS